MFYNNILILNPYRNDLSYTVYLAYTLAFQSRKQ